MAADGTRAHRHGELLNELGLILISLMLGLVIWLIASAQTTETMRLQVPIRAINVPPNVDLTVSPTSIDLQVTLPTSRRELIVPGDLQILFDARNAERRAGIERAEEWDVPINPRRDVRATRDEDLMRPITLEQPFPPEFTVAARLIAASFDVRPRLVGEAAEGHHVEGDPTVTPARVWLTAERAAIDHAVEDGLTLLTDPVSLDERGEGEHLYEPGLIVPEGYTVAGYRDAETGTVRRLAPETALPLRVTVAVAEDILDRRLAGLTPDLEQSMLREDLLLTRTEPAAFAVVLQGPTSRVEAITPDDIIVTAPLLAGINRAGISTVQVEAHLSETLPEEVREAVRVTAVEPQQIQVTLEPAAPPPEELVPPLTGSVLPIIADPATAEL